MFFSLDTPLALLNQNYGKYEEKKSERKQSNGFVFID